MAAHFDKSCLYSVVRNTSGETRRFGFLPPHGRQIEDQEEFSVFGNILEVIARKGRAAVVAFAAALDSGALEIVSTPAPIVQDTQTGLSKLLKVTNGTVGVAAPCWNTSDSLDVEPAP